MIGINFRRFPSNRGRDSGRAAGKEQASFIFGMTAVTKSRDESGNEVRVAPNPVIKRLEPYIKQEKRVWDIRTIAIRCRSPSAVDAS